MSALTTLKSMHVVESQVDIRVLAPFFWQWYHDHANDMILKRKLIVFQVTIRVRDLYPLFVQLFGPEPEHRAIFE